MSLTNHNVAERAFQLIKYEERPAHRPDGKPAEGLHHVWITLNNEKQLNSYNTEMVKEVILGLPPGLQRPGGGGGRLHRRRHQGVLHRREHRRVQRVLRGQAAGVPPVHAALQRHGLGHPRLRQAGHLPGQRHAHRRRAGDRHGLRLHHRLRPGALRAGRAAPRQRSDRRGHRLPAPVRRRRAGDGVVHRLRALERPQGLPARPHHRPGSGAEGRRRSSCRTRWWSPTATPTSSARSSTASRRPATSWPRARRSWAAARWTCRGSTPRSSGWPRRCS